MPPIFWGTPPRLRQRSEREIGFGLEVVARILEVVESAGECNDRISPAPA